MHIRKGILGMAFVLPLGVALAAQTSGCSADNTTTEAGGNTPSGGNGAGAGSSTNSGGNGAGGEGFGGFGAQGNGGFGGTEACAATSAEATLIKKPVDIMFVIDNSGSMGDNIQSVQNNINQNFASIIGASGIDYRVIMISEHGTIGNESICVSAPLSATNCMPVPAQPAFNPPIFYQYSVTVGSHNSVCHALRSYDGTLADKHALGVGGWKQWLRKEAFKVFVEVTDDGIDCDALGYSFDDNDNAASGQTTAQQIDAAILALDPEQFGTADNRNYIWHSIVGLAENNPNTAAYAPGDALVTGVCDTAEASGTGYQVLSQMTGGLRFPICEYEHFDVVFQEIAKGVIEGAKVDCEFAMPEPPEGETLDLATVVIAYTPGSGGETQKFKQVKGADDCQAGAFYIESDLIKLCPDACTVVQDDDAAKIEILFGCETEIN